ncbi:MAG: VOC family protein [Oscillospiraceae bacterium]|jgi:lactoylglutathione lyase|nr:VOC family protein [Oscillospiraceae bacterium]
MELTLKHINLNVTDWEKSLAFYQKALGLRATRREEAKDGAYIIHFLGNDKSPCKVELTWLRDKQGTYELGDNETHVGFCAADFDATHALHQQMGCICYENTAMGIYFIEDPDGYWLEIMPEGRG